MMKRAGLVGALAALAVLAAACGGGGGSEEGGTVGVALSDFAIAPDTASVGAGDVTFEATNDGPSEHELVVLKTDLAADALPVDNGKVPEESPDLEFIGEIEEFASGASESATLTLTAGHYVLVCNLTGHYEKGMATAFEVT